MRIEPCSFAYQEKAQTAAVREAIQQALELGNGNGCDAERAQMMLGYAMRNSVREVQRRAANLHQQRYSNLG